MRDARFVGRSGGSVLNGVNRRAVRAWLAVALWTALIWTLSGNEFSAQSTSGILGPLLVWLFPDLSSDGLYRLHVLVRKGAHVGEYGLLALLTLRAVRLGSQASMARSLLLVLALVLVVAGADEMRQAQASERTGSPYDVALDLAGGVFALVLVLALKWWSRARARSLAPVGAAREID